MKCQSVELWQNYLLGVNKLPMPPRKSNTLTEAELRLMKILWRRGESAVTDLVEALPEGKQLAYNSVLTTIRILEQKGYVGASTRGTGFRLLAVRPGKRSGPLGGAQCAEPLLWQLAREAGVKPVG